MVKKLWPVLALLSVGCGRLTVNDICRIRPDLCRPPVTTPTPIPTPRPKPTPVPKPTPRPTPVPTPQCAPPIGPFNQVNADPTRLEAVDGAVGRVVIKFPDQFNGGRLAGWQESSPDQRWSMTVQFHEQVITELAAIHICAIQWGDAIGVRTTSGLWEEYHLVNQGGGGIAEARFAFRNTLSYGVPTPTPTPVPTPLPIHCPLDPSRDIRLKVDVRHGAAGAAWLDVTYEYFYGVREDGTNAGPCGDPSTGAPRRWCDLGVDGGPYGVICQNELVGDPTFAALTAGVTLIPRFRDNGNLAQFFLEPGVESAVVKVCSSIRPDICTEVHVP